MWSCSEVCVAFISDCSDIDYWVQRTEPVQTIYLMNKTIPVRVLCEEGWTVIQRNINTGTPTGPQDIRTWEDYRIGFGKLSLEADTFWIGNDYLSLLTRENQQDYQLRIDMRRQSDFDYLYSEYAYFQVDPRNVWYRLSVGDCSGTAGDILGLFSTTNLDSEPFSTPDKSRAEVYGLKARAYRVGWWYPNVPSHMGPYDTPEPCFTNLNTPSPWYCGQDDEAVLLASVTMKIKPS